MPNVCRDLKDGIAWPPTTCVGRTKIPNGEWFYILCFGIKTPGGVMER